MAELDYGGDYTDFDEIWNRRNRPKLTYAELKDTQLNQALGGDVQSGGGSAPPQSSSSGGGGEPPTPTPEPKEPPLPPDERPSTRPPTPPIDTTPPWLVGLDNLKRWASPTRTSEYPYGNIFGMLGDLLGWLGGVKDQGKRFYDAQYDFNQRLNYPDDYLRASGFNPLPNGRYSVRSLDEYNALMNPVSTPVPASYPFGSGTTNPNAKEPVVGGMAGNFSGQPNKGEFAGSNVQPTSTQQPTQQPSNNSAVKDNDVLPKSGFVPPGTNSNQDLPDKNRPKPGNGGTQPSNEVAPNPRKVVSGIETDYPSYRDTIRAGVEAMGKTWTAEMEAEARRIFDSSPNVSVDVTPKTGGGSTWEDENTLASKLANYEISDAEAYKRAQENGINLTAVQNRVAGLRTARNQGGFSYTGAPAGTGFAPGTQPEVTGTTPAWTPQVYQNDQGVAKFDERDWGTISAQARPYVDQIMRAAGWIPNGQTGKYGATEYIFSGDTKPANIWLTASQLAGLPETYKQEIIRLLAAKGWTTSQ